ncbi:PA2779 family protein [Aliidiomarina haloalkalitolerans]|nr:PA2779 family protein [Aliidiomarina haloalkalitolerans]
MKKSLFLGTTMLLSSFALTTAVVPTAQADIVSTADVVAEQQSGWNRAQLVEQLHRDEVREQLVRYGVNPDDAIARVDALTDAEVLELTAHLDELPAGAGISVSTTVILIALIIWLVFFR